MKIKMKPQEIVNKMEGLSRVVSAEEKYCETKAAAKYPVSVAMAIAKNRKVFEDEILFIQEQQRKNQLIAEKSGKDLGDVKEQKELLETEIEIDIRTVSEKDIMEARDLSSADYYDLMFMVE